MTKIIVNGTGCQEILKEQSRTIKVFIPKIDGPNYRSVYDYAYLFLRTGICTHGYNTTCFKRHFVAKFCKPGQYRSKYGKTWHETDILDKYILADNMDECLSRLATYLQKDVPFWYESVLPKNLRR